ncbi:MAG: hypothetical protein DWQ01_14000 [Planctomycetota bacterium]|nr:MAG: hypothetical protein DWQ01_14000 [Planctomycetota bacterium]
MGVPACFGGGGNSSANPAAATFRLRRCSLGCNSGTCAVNEIATNQEIKLSFNDKVDPATVSFTTISIVERTTGSSPPGSFLVEGSQVIFRPALLETQSGIRFGFTDGANYEITMLASPQTSVVRSRIGRPNTTALSCVVQTNGVADLVPGNPEVSFTPNQSQPPTQKNFSFEIIFNDLMQKFQLVDPDTGESPTIGVTLVDESIPGRVLEVAVSGTFEASLDQDLLQTVVTFTPDAPFPGNKNGGRYLRLEFSPQIADLAGNTLANSGTFTVPLPDSVIVPGSFLEGFADESQLDPLTSVSGLWAGTAGSLDSGLDPTTGKHSGGGHGLLGPFAPTADFTFDTDGMTFLASEWDIFIQEDVVVDGSLQSPVFMFDQFNVPAGVTIHATGANPLRIATRGEAVVNGVLDVSGEDAPNNFGKYFPILWELIDTIESSLDVTRANAEGGVPGMGALGGGSGGTGGQAWYLLNNYFDSSKNTYTSGIPDPTRFRDGINSDTVHGYNGEGIGGAVSSGRPLLSPDQMAVDRANGGGMGSWAWPPSSNLVPAPTGNKVIQSHFNTVSGLYYKIALHRSRGGGGGGFWSDGTAGGYYDSSGTDPLGVAFSSAPEIYDPVIDESRDAWEYNSLLAWDELDAQAIPDAAGGVADLLTNFPGVETLDPNHANGNRLLGGAGGGGAGCGEHGSWDDDALSTDGFIDTYRNGDGGGGGAGGGALQFQVGGRLAVGGLIQATGGHGADSEFMSNVPHFDINAIIYGTPGDAGGGGGSGGGILIQVAGDMTVDPDAVDVQGGRGGIGSAGNHGGEGGSGLVRFETATGSESLATLQAMVVPDGAVDLAPIGQAGSANVSAVANAFMTGEGDITASDGSLFRGNSSGVRSLWYAPDAAILLLTFESYAIRCSYDAQDGNGVQSLVFDLSNPPDPGVTPIWVAFQTGFGNPAPGAPVEPDEGSESEWIIPGFGTITDGLVELQASLARMVRFQIVFDHDLLATLIGTNPGAYFQVDSVEFGWEGDS